MARSRLCVIVCGLHRSGTSALTRVVNLLGADIASDLIAARPDNIRGYWEPTALVNIHNGLLTSIGSPIGDFLDPLTLPPDWTSTGAAQHAKQRLERFIEEEFAESSLFVVKDPRISRLLPLWLELLDALDIERIVLIPFRNPLEVAQSLKQRDCVGLSKSLLLYFHSYLETELASRASPRLFVRYNNLLQDWHAFAKRLGEISGLRFPTPSAEIANQIDAFLTTDLYHHRFSREQVLSNPDVPAAIVEMFDRMCEAAATGEEQPLRLSFDRLRAIDGEVAALYRGYVMADRRTLRETFEESTSWRITAPLRRIKSAIERFL